MVVRTHDSTNGDVKNPLIRKIICAPPGKDEVIRYYEMDV